MYNKYSRHTMMTMKIFPLALALLVSMPSVAFAGYGQSGFSRQCFKEVYREEYEPGTIYSPGRVRRWTEQREVPCEGETTGYLYQEYPDPIPPTPHQSAYVDPYADNNSCIEGAVLGGIAGGGAGYAASRGDGRGWAIPLGVVGGVLLGCQLDGG